MDDSSLCPILVIHLPLPTAEISTIENIASKLAYRFVLLSLPYRKRKQKLRNKLGYHGYPLK